MSADVLQHVWTATSTRLLGDGVPGGDLLKARASLERWAYWVLFRVHGLGRALRPLLLRGDGGAERARLRVRRRLPGPQVGRAVSLRTLDLAGTAERVRVPVYALHGAQDRLIPASQVDKLRAALAGNPEVTFDLPADGDHCCHNLYHVVRPRMADWAAERLGGRL